MSTSVRRERLATTRQITTGSLVLGLGLGLAVSKGIIEAHGGGISIQSKERGLGTAVAMQLPVHRG